MREANAIIIVIILVIAFFVVGDIVREYTAEPTFEEKRHEACWGDDVNIFEMNDTEYHQWVGACS